MRFGTRFAAAALASWLGLALAAAAQTVEPETLRMTQEERQADHDDRETQLKKRIAEAEARWRAERARIERDNPARGDEARERAALANFHAALAAFERTGRTGRLTLLQLGDSHTAGDNWSGYLRERLQRRFGDGGRGMIVPGKPFRDYRPYQLRVAQTGEWANFSYRDWTGTGIGFYAAQGRQGQDTIEASTRGLKSFDTVEIELMRATDGGSFTLDIDGHVVRTVTTKGRNEFERLNIPLAQPGRHATIALKGDGPVTLLSWSLLRKNGLVYVSHGVSGETVNLLGRWHPGLAHWQIAALNPALVIVAFGTNEGFTTRFKPEEYESDFRERLQGLRAMIPNASIVIATAPDGARLPSWCARRAAQRERYDCRPLRAGHAENYVDLIERKSRDICYWHSPPTLEQVRRLQRKVADQLGLYFWDWSRVMRGECGMDRWARMSPPLSTVDRVHMKLEGYDLSGEALYQDLLRHYSPGRR
jgi:lysophospholipase L1-like esterase